MMDLSCPRCRAENPSVARFCARCGLMLESLDGGPLVAGRMRHPEPLPAPEGFEPCADAVDVYFRCESAWGGARLLGTEGVSATLFNGGYPLEDVVLMVRGTDDCDREVFVVEHTVNQLPRGRELAIEIPSYEFPGPVHAVRLSLVAAEFTLDT